MNQGIALEFTLFTPTYLAVLAARLALGAGWQDERRLKRRGAQKARTASASKGATVTTAVACGTLSLHQM